MGGKKPKVSKQELLDALAQTQGSASEAARLLGVSIRTVYDRMKAYGVKTPKRRSKGSHKPRRGFTEEAARLLIEKATRENWTLPETVEAAPVSQATFWRRIKSYDLGHLLDPLRGRAVRPGRPPRITKKRLKSLLKKHCGDRGRVAQEIGTRIDYVIRRMRDFEFVRPGEKPREGCWPPSREEVVTLLHEHRGSRDAVADVLWVDPRTLYRLLKDQRVTSDRSKAAHEPGWIYVPAPANYVAARGVSPDMEALLSLGISPEGKVEATLHGPGGPKVSRKSSMAAGQDPATQWLRERGISMPLEPLPPPFRENPPGKRFLVRSPAQGLKTIQHPAITSNYKKALRWKPRHKKAVLVPCAQTKPFPDAPSHRDGYLKALKGKDADLWVVSEPLGVVPYAWSRDWPNGHYDFPPRHLKGDGRDLLADRIATWFERVGPKYSKVTLALPGHHMRLVEDALAQLPELKTKIVYAGIGDCLDAGACPPGHYRASSHAYRKFLKRRANPPLGADWLTPRVAARLRDLERCLINERTRLYGHREGQLVCEDAWLRAQPVVELESGQEAQAEFGLVIRPGIGGAPTGPAGAPRDAYWHWWLRLDDGTIVDVASSQFGERSPLVIPPGHPLQRRYLPEAVDLAEGVMEEVWDYSHWAPNPADPRRRSAERAFRDRPSAETAMPYFQEIVRRGDWSAMRYPALFWVMLEIPGGPELMVEAAREGDARVMYWEVFDADLTYRLLRAFRMGYRGRVEIWHHGYSHSTLTHVAGTPGVLLSPDDHRMARIWIPGMDQICLASITGPTVKKYAGKVFKTPGSGQVIFPARIESVRIMDQRTGKGGRVRWKNPADPRRRRAERGPVDVTSEAAAINERIRQGLVSPANVAVACDMGYAAACGVVAPSGRMYRDSKRELVIWVMELISTMIPTTHHGGMTAQPIEALTAWLRKGGRINWRGIGGRPPGWNETPRDPDCLARDAIRIVNAATEKGVAKYVRRIVKNYAGVVNFAWQEDAVGYETSPAWQYRDESGKLILEPPRATHNQLRRQIREIAERNARDQLFRILLHEGPAAQPSWEIFQPNPPEACGDCFQAAFRYIMDAHVAGFGLGGQDLRLIHAKVHGQGPLEGRVIDHAWVEETIVPKIPEGVELPHGLDPEAFAIRIAVDRSQGRDIQMPVSMYRGLGGAHDVREYDWAQAAKFAGRSKHYGPWE